MIDYNKLYYLRKHTVISLVDKLKIQKLKAEASKYSKLINKMEHCNIGVNFRDADTYEYSRRFSDWMIKVFPLWKNHNDGMDLFTFSEEVLDQAIEREGMRVMKDKLSGELSNLEEVIKNLSVKSSDLVVKIILALIVMIIGYRIISIIERRLKKPGKFNKLDANAKGFIISFATISLKVLLIIIVLSIVGVPMASIVTIVGSCAVAIGLALQGGLSNIAGGLMLLIFKPFKVGDYISSNGFDGTVKTITIFYTTIVTVDNKVVQLPNGNLSNSNIINYSANEKRRVDIDVSVAYSSDIDKVKEVLNKIINAHELILPEEDKFVRLRIHGESALVFTLRVWVKTSDYWTVYFDLMESIKKEFDKNHIEIPFNQLDVHMVK